MALRDKHEMRATLVTPLLDNDVTAGFCGRPEVSAHSLPSPHARTDVNFRRAIMGLGRHELTKQCVCVCVCVCVPIDTPQPPIQLTHVDCALNECHREITLLCGSHVVVSSRDLNAEISR